MKNEHCVTLVETYYKAMKEKNLKPVEHYLHAEVHFLTPLVNSVGKDAYLEAFEKFSAFFINLNIRTILGGENQAVIIYDIEFPAPIESMRTASLLTFERDLIKKIELFYDASPFKMP